MGFSSEYYSMFMYVAISIVTMLIFFNSINIVETGLDGFEKGGNEFGKGLTGLVVEEIEEEVSGKASFDSYLEKVVENDKPKSKFSRGLTGLVIIEDEKGNEIEVDNDKVEQFAVDLDKKEEEPELIEGENGELYTEGSYMIYFALLGFLGLSVFIVTAFFFLPKLKDLT
jgi:hypothetical protein